MSPFRIVHPLLLLSFLFYGSISFARTDSLYAPRFISLKLNNAMTLLLQPIENENTTEISLYIKTGSVYETDTLKGIAHVLQTIKAAKVVAYLQQNNSNADLQNIVFSSEATTEHAAFKFVTTASNAEACLRLIQEVIFLSPIKEEELKAAKDSVMQEIEAKKGDTRAILEGKLTKRIYRQDYQKLNITGDSAGLRNITPSIIRDFSLKYYVINNAAISVTGNFNTEIFLATVKQIFEPMMRGDFDPETVTKMIHYRPMIYSSQFVVEDSTVVAPEFHICWQFPGVNVNQQASYSAYLLTSILNDPNNFIQAKARKMGCKKLTAQYEPNNFSGIFRVIIQPDKNDVYPVFAFVLNELMQLEKTIINESMLNVGKIQFRNRFRLLQTTKYFSDQAVKYMAYRDNYFYQELADSIWAVSEKNFKIFIRDYMTNNPHVAALRISAADRSSLNTDSLFSEMDENVGSYVFRYRQNITDIEGVENNTLLSNLLQWLRINDDVNVQVNGFSDEGEYNRFKSDTIVQFIDSLPSFARSKPGIVKKGYMNPDMMRALKIIKFLYDNGIEAERLSGTGMRFSSDTDEEAVENYKCTLTLNKMHQNQSLYEKHYGREKE